MISICGCVKHSDDDVQTTESGALWLSVAVLPGATVSTVDSGKTVKSGAIGTLEAWGIWTMEVAMTLMLPALYVGEMGGDALESLTVGGPAVRGGELETGEVDAGPIIPPELYVP